MMLFISLPSVMCAFLRKLGRMIYHITVPVYIVYAIKFYPLRGQLTKAMGP